MLDALHHPAPAAQKEAADPVDQAIDKLMLQRAEGLASCGHNCVAHGAGEYRKELHKVLAAKALLCLGANHQLTRCLPEAAVGEQPSDEAIKFRSADPCKIRNA